MSIKIKTGLNGVDEFEKKHVPEEFRRSTTTTSNDVAINAWFGVSHTGKNKYNFTIFITNNIYIYIFLVTPLHHDPYNNLLSQVIGSKRIVLIDHKYTGKRLIIQISQKIAKIIKNIQKKFIHTISMIDCIGMRVVSSICVRLTSIRSLLTFSTCLRLNAFLAKVYNWKWIFFIYLL